MSEGIQIIKAGTPDIWDITGNIVSNIGSKSTVGTDDFVFGSPQLDDDGDTDHDNRMFFDKSKGAFSAGTVTGNRWDESNVGDFSVRLGNNCQASGESSIAGGQTNTCEGIATTAFGKFNNIDSGVEGGFAVGQGNEITGDRGITIGTDNTSSAFSAIAIGSDNLATSSGTVAIGDTNTSSRSRALTIGVDNSVVHVDGLAIGNSNTISSSFSDNFCSTIGSFNTVSDSNNSLTIGSTNTIDDGDNAFCLGNFAGVTADGGFTIGSGVDSLNLLNNPISNTLMFGINSTVPTMIISNSGGIGGFGNVGIGLSDDEQMAQFTMENSGSFSSTGTSTMTAGSAIVTGVSTLFLTEVSPGDTIDVGGTARTVLSVQSDTSLTVTSNAANRAGTATITPSILRIQDSSLNNILYINPDHDVLIGPKTIGTDDITPSAKLDVRGSVVFNEDGGDNDVRMEGDTRVNMFFLDASADSVNINDNASLGTLNIRETNTTQPGLFITHGVNANVIEVVKNTGSGSLIDFSSTAAQNSPVINLTLLETGTFVSNSDFIHYESNIDNAVDTPANIGFQATVLTNKATQATKDNFAYGCELKASSNITGLAMAGQVGRFIIGDANIEGIRILRDDNQAADLINCIDDLEATSFFRVDSDGSVITAGNIQTQAGTPAQITSNQNDYDFGTEGFVRLSTDAERTITGLDNGANGRKVTIVNVGSNDLILANQNASSSAENRIITNTGLGLVLAPNESADADYDSTDSRWRITNFNGSSDFKCTLITSADSPYTVTDYNFIVCDASGGAITVNLPASGGVKDTLITVKKVDSSLNAVTIDGNGSETIDGATTQVISSQWNLYGLKSDGSNWLVT